MSAGWMSGVVRLGMAATAVTLAVASEPAVGQDGPAVRPAIGRVLSTDTSASSDTKHIKSKTKTNAKVKKVDGFTVKQASPRAFNPNEFKLDKKSPTPRKYWGPLIGTPIGNAIGN